MRYEITNDDNDDQDFANALNLLDQVISPVILLLLEHEQAMMRTPAVQKSFFVRRNFLGDKSHYKINNVTV
jgi:hypothetical protein